MGPMAYVQHLLSGPRLPFSAAYFGSLVMSIYFSIGVSTISMLLTPMRPCLLTTACLTAPKHNLDPYIGHHSDCLLALVSRQLLSDGFEQLEDGDNFWSTTSGCLDDGLSLHREAISVQLEGLYVT